MDVEKVTLETEVLDGIPTIKGIKKGKCVEPLQKICGGNGRKIVAVFYKFFF